jgi:hypothetical protein
MKSLCLLFITSILLFQVNVNSQSISNSGFENWGDILYFENPELYNSTNTLSYFANGTANVTKSTDAYSGNYALKVETILVDDEVIEGGVVIGEISEDFILGGIPFDERPDAITGFAKFDVMENDTAYVAVLFKKFGAPLGICFAQFYGTQNEYVEFTAPVQWLLPIISPDTIAVGILSSTIFSDAIPGSTLTVDSISFVGATIPFPNGDFEDWEDFSSEEPDDWFTSNVFSLSVGETSVTKSTDSYEGSFAALIETKPTIFGDTLAFITNGEMGEDNPIGGMQVDSTPDKLSGYYKYIPVGPDTAIGGLFLYHYNENTSVSELLEESFIKLPPADVYTYFEVEVDYFSLPEPDTVNIAFASSNLQDYQTYIGLGSELYLDALNITYKPNLVSTIQQKQEIAHQVYPNPASDKIFIEFQKIFKSDISVKVMNAEGGLVYQKYLNPMATKQLDIPVNGFKPGFYFYSIESANSNVKGKFIVH